MAQGGWKSPPMDGNEGGSEHAVGLLRCFACCSCDFGQVVPFSEVGFGPFCEQELVVTVGVSFQELQRKNKTFFLGIEG